MDSPAFCAAYGRVYLGGSNLLCNLHFGSLGFDMGLLNSDALSSRLKDPANWKGTDDDTFLMRWRLKRKTWFAFPWRGPQGVDLSFLASIVFLPGLLLIPVLRRWREFPITLFAIRGAGYWRFENSSGSFETSLRDTTRRVLFFFYPSLPGDDNAPLYLSRQQLWTRWSFQLQWPLFIAFHWYKKPLDVIPQGEHVDRDGCLFFAYRFWHRDTDAYWGDGGFLGGNWK